MLKDLFDQQEEQFLKQNNRKDELISQLTTCENEKAFNETVSREEILSRLQIFKKYNNAEIEQDFLVDQIISAKKETEQVRAELRQADKIAERLSKEKEAKEKLLSGVKARGAIEYFEDYYGAEAVINKTEIKERYKSVDNENFEESTEERNRKTSNQAKTGEEGKGQTGNQVKTGKTGTYQERKQMRKEQAEKQKKAKARQIDARESNRRVREAKWLWIFQNRGWDVRVRKLREVIEKSNYSQINTVPKFCKAISEAYGDLSIWVVHRILYLEKTGDMYIADLTLGEESSSAVALLLSTINTKAPSKIDGRLL